MSINTYVKKMNHLLMILTVSFFLTFFTSLTVFAAAPTVTSETMDYNDNVKDLVITGTDFVQNCDLSKFHLNDVTGTDDVTLTGAVCVIDNVNQITITLTEAQRVDALAISAVFGGNGGTVVLDVDAGAIEDAGAIANIQDDNNAVTETADTNAPTITGVTLDYNDNVRELVVSFSETIDASASDKTKFHINNATGTDLVTLSTATTSADGTSLTFVLTESERVDALNVSGVAGGDGGAVVLDVDASGFADMGTTVNAISDNNAVTETADTTAPTVTAGNISRA